MTGNDKYLTRLIERFYHEVWNQKDEACAREILHADFDFRGSLGPVRTGPEGFIKYMRELWEGLPDFRCDIEEVIDAGSSAAAKMTFSGTHQGVFYGTPGTGRVITWAGGAFFKGDGHQITALWVLGDIDAIKRQLGDSVTADFI
ncbi:ester cyclase [Sneathiella sp.]|uniref:ester cyclase n=1 Tax=Sneathiella sp. TaxID=1964365 RepID=UPI0035680CB0